MAGLMQRAVCLALALSRSSGPSGSGLGFFLIMRFGCVEQWVLKEKQLGDALVEEFRGSKMIMGQVLPTPVDTLRSLPKARENPKP